MNKNFLVIIMSVFFQTLLVAQTQVSGTISDDDGQPLPGATIIEKGTNNGVVTDFDGNYSIEVNNSDSSIIISFVGYQTKEVLVGDSSSFDFTLSPDNALDEVVITGYGTQVKRDLTGSIVQVKSEDFVKGANTNALQLLNGKASGVHISQSDSAPGGAIDIKIRGAGSINASNDVLVVIDGLPGGSLTSLSPDDIESIEVLKDASASAIYGSRAANGVVLITTKRGKVGEMQISYENYFGFQDVNERVDMLNGGEYLQVLSDINVAGGGDVLSTPAEIAAMGAGYDWQDIIFRNSMVQNHQFTMSGGSETSNYYVSLNYLENEGVIKESGERKYNARINYGLTPNDKININLNLSINRSEIDNVKMGRGTNEGVGLLAAALLFDPTIGPEVNSEGYFDVNPLVAIENPQAILEGWDRQVTSNRIYATASVDYEIIEGLTATARFGTNLLDSRSDLYENDKFQVGRGVNGRSSITNNERTYFIGEYLANYEKEFGDHNFKVLAGITYESNQTRRHFSRASDMLSHVTTTNLQQSGNPETLTAESGKFKNTLQSSLARINYSFKDKYLVTASVRRDGTSRFSDKYKYATFPSASVGWKLSSEPFMEKMSLFNELKLRVGYGEIGNQGIQNFETITTFQAGSNAILGGTTVSGAVPARIANQDLKWETTKETNIGVDFSLANNRFSGSIDYFDRNTYDQLFQQPVPFTTGFQFVRTNFGQVKNSGVDFSFSSRNVDKNWTWDTDLVFSFLNNEVVQLPDFAAEVISGGFGFSGNYRITREGSPILSFFGYEIDGIFQESDNIANSAQPNALPGHPIFRDQNGDNKIDGNDRVILGDPFADITFGITNRFGYKDFTLEVYVQGVQGIENFSNLAAESLYPINKERNHLAIHYLDRWTTSNTDAAYPSGVNYTAYSDGENKVNTYTVQDASFVRLKNITLNYNLPLANVDFIKSGNVYISGENLLTIAPDYVGFDPDGNSDGTGVSRADFANYPLARVIRIGCKLNF
ncbi:MAG: TonB-dependent receptor [Flavobacteriaceae bacterium]|jgi:TonB-linked SusC/RagA family outer membrane protein